MNELTVEGLCEFRWVAEDGLSLQGLSNDASRGITIAIEGEPKEYVKIAESGNKRVQAFLR